jgi:hypothetical protein
MNTPNCYVGTAAFSEQEAREICADAFHAASADELVLVHVEQAEDAEECATFIFSFHADSSEQEEGEWLHDLYELAHLPNMPCEII